MLEYQSVALGDDGASRFGNNVDIKKHPLMRGLSSKMLTLGILGLCRRLATVCAWTPWGRGSASRTVHIQATPLPEPASFNSDFNPTTMAWIMMAQVNALHSVNAADCVIPS